SEGCDQVAVEVVDEALQPLDVVADVAKGLVAEVTEHAANTTRLLVVVDMLGLVGPAGSADTALCLEHCVDLCLPDAITPAQVILARAAIAVSVALSDLVMTRLAVSAVAASSGAVPWKVLRRLHRLACRAPTLLVGYIGAFRN